MPAGYYMWKYGPNAFNNVGNVPDWVTYLLPIIGLIVITLFIVHEKRSMNKN